MTDYSTVAELIAKQQNVSDVRVRVLTGTITKKEVLNRGSR